MFIIDQTTAENAAMVAPGFDAAGVYKNGMRAKGGSKNALDEAFLRLAFSKNVEPDQSDGLPPTTFFSHNSDSV